MSRSFVNSWKTVEGLGFAEPSSYGGKGDFGRPFFVCAFANSETVARTNASSKIIGLLNYRPIKFIFFKIKNFL